MRNSAHYGFFLAGSFVLYGENYSRMRIEAFTVVIKGVRDTLYIAFYPTRISSAGNQQLINIRKQICCSFDSLHSLYSLFLLKLSSLSGHKGTN